MLDLNKVLKKEDKLTDNLTHKRFDSLDNTMVILEISLKREVFSSKTKQMEIKPLIIEKSFRNNYDGKQALDKAAKEFDTEDKVKTYLGLK